MILHYKIWNNNPAPCQNVVFLHGMGGTGLLWRPLAAHLEDEYKVIALDQRGHGKSQIPTSAASRDIPTYTPLDYGQDIVETLNSLQLSSVFLIGHSMGVRTAVAAAYLQPQLIQGLVLIDLGFSGVAGGGLGEGLAVFLKKLPQEFSTRQEAQLFMHENCPDPSISQYLMAVSVKTENNTIAFPFDKSALIQTIIAARDGSVRNWVKKLGELQMPILILRGEKSLVWSRHDFLEEQKNLSSYPSIQFAEIPNAGHGLPFEQRTLFLEKLKFFLKSIER